MNILKPARAAARWLKRRLKERSTFIGAAMVATALGWPELAAKIGEFGQIAAILFGTGLAAATTSQHPDIEDIIDLGAKITKRR